jgi:clan AA aspartic protease
VNGTVDNSLRALLEISVAPMAGDKKQAITAWIDTAFNGGLAIPRRHVERLALKQASITQAVLADGNWTELETFICHLEWFGNQYRTQVVANEGEFALIGTQLLANRKLVIDYQKKTVVLD